ncbi:MAG: hypothetical protein HJJLKODD_02895 [Phycisphaerae bacterium]|nr:hypothetical protein [Phycisphaerae bacterium]
MAIPSIEQLRNLANVLEEIARNRLQIHLHDDRREAQRFPFRQIMRYATIDDARLGSSWRQILSFNVSHLGIGVLIGEKPFRTGTMVVLDCVPGQVRKIYLPGLVVRHDTPISGIWEVGIHFQFQPQLLHNIVLD